MQNLRELVGYMCLALAEWPGMSSEELKTKSGLWFVKGRHSEK